MGGGLVLLHIKLKAKDDDSVKFSFFDNNVPMRCYINGNMWILLPQLVNSGELIEIKEHYL
jgi:hypothetical protein